MKAENDYKVRMQETKIKSLKSKGKEDEIKEMILVKRLTDEQLQIRSEINLLERRATEASEKVAADYRIKVNARLHSESNLTT